MNILLFSIWQRPTQHSGAQQLSKTHASEILNQHPIFTKYHNPPITAAQLQQQRKFLRSSCTNKSLRIMLSNVRVQVQLTWNGQLFVFHLVSFTRTHTRAHIQSFKSMDRIKISLTLLLIELRGRKNSENSYSNCIPLFVGCPGRSVLIFEYIIMCRRRYRHRRCRGCRLIHRCWFCFQILLINILSHVCLHRLYAQISVHSAKWLLQKMVWLTNVFRRRDGFLMFDAVHQWVQ